MLLLLLLLLPILTASAERERISATNLASTMVTMLVNNPLAPQLDLTSLRILSCGGSPQSPAGVGMMLPGGPGPAYLQNSWLVGRSKQQGCLLQSASHAPGTDLACPPSPCLQWWCAPLPCLAVSSFYRTA